METQNIFDEMVELMKSLEVDEGGHFIRPTRYAFDRAWGMLKGVATVVRNFPYGVAIAVDGRLRIEWSQDDKRVITVWGANEKDNGYIYHRSGNETCRDVMSVENLSYYLKKLI